MWASYPAVEYGKIQFFLVVIENICSMIVSLYLLKIMEHNYLYKN